MTGWLWTAAIFLTLVGALFYWGARVLAEDSLYAQAVFVLLMALLCVGLASL